MKSCDLITYESNDSYMFNKIIILIKMPVFIYPWN